MCHQKGLVCASCSPSLHRAAVVDISAKERFLPFFYHERVVLCVFAFRKNNGKLTLTTLQPSSVHSVNRANTHFEFFLKNLVHYNIEDMHTESLACPTRVFHVSGLTFRVKAKEKAWNVKLAGQIGSTIRPTVFRVQKLFFFFLSRGRTSFLIPVKANACFSSFLPAWPA